MIPFLKITPQSARRMWVEMIKPGSSRSYKLTPSWLRFYVAKGKLLNIIAYYSSPSTTPEG